MDAQDRQDMRSGNELMSDLVSLTSFFRFVCKIVLPEF